MKKHGVFALALGFSSLLFQGCFETPSPVSEEQTQNEQEVATAAAVAAAGIDLQFTTANVTGSTGTGFTYSYTIKNQGTVAIADLYNVSIQNFYSANTIYNDAGDDAAGGSIFGIQKALAAGASHTGTFYSSGGVPAGKPYLICKSIGTMSSPNRMKTTIPSPC